MFQIKELSKRVGISSKTIRYYEDIELLPEPKRADNGYRVYDETDVDRLCFVSSARNLDFALGDIREILAFRDRQEPPCQYVMNVMADQIETISARIQQLEELRAELLHLQEQGKQLPEDALMKDCVCHLIETVGEKTNES